MVQCMSIAFVGTSHAQVVLFDFNSIPIHTPFPVSQTVNGITAHLSGTGQGYSIQDANVLGFTPAGFSGNVIYPNSVYLADLLIKFNTTIKSFSIMYACQELACDNAATMRVTAFKNGILAGTNTHTAANPGTWPTDTLKCSFLQGFDSVVVHYASPPPTCQDYGVIFMADNMKVTKLTTFPVSLLYFNCESKGNNAILQWKSAEEVNLSNYTVQYSNDGKTFEDVERIPAKGANNNYVFVHPDVKGMAFYRLKITDADGACYFSTIKSIHFKPNADIAIVPNPSHHFIQVVSHQPLNVKIIQIVSMYGVVFKTINTIAGEKNIYIGDLSTGLYVLKAFSSENSIVFEKRFLKM